MTTRQLQLNELRRMTFEELEERPDDYRWERDRAFDRGDAAWRHWMRMTDLVTAEMRRRDTD
jgi:hypothetical protein